MITYNKIIRYDNLDFDNYLKLKGYSHSWLKNQRNGVTPVFNMTDNIRLGSLVDSILTEPAKANINHSLYNPAKNIAYSLQTNFRSLIDNFKKQISYTAVMEYKGFEILTTGRIDYLLEAHAVIDLKITKSKDVKALIEFMGYRNQLWHYARLSNVRKAYLMIYSIPLKKTFIIPVDISGRCIFWEESILNFGKVIETV